MKKLFIIVGLLVFSSLAHAQFENNEFGEHLLERARNSYLTIKRYEGNSASISYFESREQKLPVIELTARQAQIDYTRGGLLKINGGDTAGMTFSVWSDDKISKFTLTNAGRTQTTAGGDLESTLASASGVSGNTASTIPSILAGLNWGNPLINKGKTTFKRTELIGKHDCFVVEKELPQLQTVQTFWIDHRTYLLRQFKQNTVQSPLSEKELEALSTPLRQQAQKVKAAYLLTTEIFSIDNLEFEAGKDPRGVFELPDGVERIVLMGEEGNLVRGETTPEKQ